MAHTPPRPPSNAEQSSQDEGDGQSREYVSFPASQPPAVANTKLFVWTDDNEPVYFFLQPDLHPNLLANFTKVIEVCLNTLFTLKPWFPIPWILFVGSRRPLSPTGLSSRTRENIGRSQNSRRAALPARRQTRLRLESCVLYVSTRLPRCWHASRSDTVPGCLPAI